jgi:hypothetical protein
MFSFTTCRDCGGLLHVTDDDTVHPGCTPRPTRMERLLADFLAAATMGDQPELEAELEAEIDALESGPPEMRSAALAYASCGWPVFPLLARSKQPATRHGFKDATADPERIAQWWDRHPDSNIGLPTGHLFDVIDIDLPDGPVSFAAQLEKELLLGKPMLQCHGRVTTASGGQHLYIEPTGDPNGAGIMAGIDYRGLGGYVVAPPSVSDSRSWRWDMKPSPTIRKVGG